MLSMPHHSMPHHAYEAAPGGPAGRLPLAATRVGRVGPATRRGSAELRRGAGRRNREGGGALDSLGRGLICPGLRRAAVPPWRWNGEGGSENCCAVRIVTITITTIIIVIIRRRKRRRRSFDGLRRAAVPPGRWNREGGSGVVRRDSENNNNNNNYYYYYYYFEEEEEEEGMTTERRDPPG